MIDISFIIPMYNAEKYIGECIDSILKQGIAESMLEILVVDDGSTDNGKDIVRKYPCVKYIYQNNAGQSVARNVGIDAAQGNYICFVDADDQLIPGGLMPCLSKIKELNLDAIMYGVVRSGIESEHTSSYKQAVDVESVITGVEYLERYNYNNGPWWYIIRRDRLGDLRFLTGHYGEDGMFTMELLMRLKRVAKINRDAYIYIERNNSITTRQDENHMRKMIDDYLFCYRHMVGLVRQYHDTLPALAIQRCTERAETYLFFLLIRLLRYPHASLLIDDIILQMKAENCYPIRRPSRDDYKGGRYDILIEVINRPWLLKIVNSVYTRIKR